MRGTMWLTALGCGILLSSSGCCGFLREGVCGCQSCGQSDGDCGQVRRPYRERIYGDDGCQCSSCRNNASCNECADECGSCCQRNFCFHPLRWIGGLFYAGTWCGPSCCGFYRGEVIDDPADCCDPCDRVGRWTGRGGCATCNHGGVQESGDLSPIPEGATLQDDPVMDPVPTKVPPKATRRASPSNYGR